MNEIKHFLNAHLMMTGFYVQNINLILSLIINTFEKAYVIV
jgi:hypothetical protein